MTRPRLIFEKQWLHVLGIAVLVAGLVAASGIDGMHEGRLLGIATPAWIWLAVGVAIVHQEYVWFCWRTQLHGRWLTRALGDRAFPAAATVRGEQRASRHGHVPR